MFGINKRRERYFFSSARFELRRLEPGETYETEDMSECTLVIDIGGERPIVQGDWLRFLKMTRLDEDKRVLFDSAHQIITRCLDGRIEVAWDSTEKGLDSDFCTLQVTEDRVSLTVKDGPPA